VAFLLRELAGKQGFGELNSGVELLLAKESLTTEEFEPLRRRNVDAVSEKSAA
jgi:hypothetical protein